MTPDATRGIEPAAASVARTSYRSLAGSFAGLLGGQVVNVLYQLASVPVLISALGQSAYAGWLLLLTLPSYLALSDFGIATVGANEMTMLIARGDREDCAKVYGEMWGGLALVGTVLSVCVLTVLPFINWSSVAGLQGVPASEIRISIVLLVLATVAAQAMGLTLGAFRAIGRYGTGLQISNASKLLELCLLIGTLRLTTSFASLTCILLFARILPVLVARKVLGEVAPWLRFSWQLGSLKRVAKLLPAGLLFLAFPLGASVLESGNHMGGRTQSRRRGRCATQSCANACKCGASGLEPYR